MPISRKVGKAVNVHVGGGENDPVAIRKNFRGVPGSYTKLMVTPLPLSTMVASGGVTPDQISKSVDFSIPQRRPKSPGKMPVTGNEIFPSAMTGFPVTGLMTAVPLAEVEVVNGVTTPFTVALPEIERESS